MAFQLYRTREPRALILTSDSYALILKRPPTPTTQGSGASVVVEFLPKSDVRLDDAVLLNARVSGCLGVLRIANETFLAMITASLSLGTSSRFLSGYGVEPISRILAVEFFCLTSAAFDNSPLDAGRSDAYDDAGSYQASTSRLEVLEHPCASIRKILSSGSFYYSGGGSNAFDLSTRLQARLSRAEATRKGKEVGHDQTERSDHFLWNTYLVTPLLDFRASLPTQAREAFDLQAFVVLTIQGYCGVYDVKLGGQPAVISLISRLGWKRAGTRFAVRGIDDDGSVANFVETETILRTPETCFSYVQTRGSVPVFWEEGTTGNALQALTPKITITRPLEASLPAFVRHFEDLIETYGTVHCVNLLSSKDQEAALSDAYEAHLRAAGQFEERIRDRVSLTEFDFHAQSRIGGIESVKAQLASTVGPAEESFGACITDVRGDGSGSLIMPQRDVFRTNCKDCLDRTNVVEDILSRFALESFILSTNPAWQGSDLALWNAHRTLFAENGDALSKIYVGTGAINTSFTRSGKKSFAGLLSDATKSVGRMYQSQFVDSGKQRAIDALLGHLATSEKVRVFDPINDQLRARLREASDEFTSRAETTLWVGTYNLNGKGPGSESLLPWMFPVEGPEPSMLVISFQEIVPLTPAMIMATDPNMLRRWEAHILRSLAERPNKKSDYVLLRSAQLVGTALLVLVKTELANEIKNIEAATKKTGLKGMAGNKGAVAIRLEYRDTSFCFLTAHLAAGHSNYLERDADYFTIAEGLHFSKGKRIKDHDNVIWAADTNYRISLPNEEVRGLAEADAFAELLEADQLGAGMQNRGVFNGYYEAPILFRPTYKYDNFSDQYDTSEKARIPAWTDRIIYMGREIDVNRYQRAELMTSDHRPVYAIFRAQIRTVDPVKKAALRKRFLSEIVTHGSDESLDDKLSRVTIQTNGHVSASLPPPSDDKQAWWNGSDGSFALDLKTGAGGIRNATVSNPFAPEYYIQSPVTRPPQPAPKPPPLKPAASSTAPTKAPSVRRKPPPPTPSPTSLIGEFMKEEQQAKSVKPPASPVKERPPIPARPTMSALKGTSDADGQRHAAEGSWQMIDREA